MAAGGKSEGVSVRFTEIMFRVVLLALLAWFPFIHGMVTNHSERLAVIEATRFTDEDGRMLLDRMMDRIGQLPPDWFREQMTEVRSSQKNFQEEVRAWMQRTEQRLDQIERKIGR